MPLNFEPGWESRSQIEVTVQGYLTFKELVGNGQFSMPVGSNLKDLLIMLPQRLSQDFREQACDPQGDLRPHIAVLLNGRHCRHLVEWVNTVLKDGDVVAIFPPIVGG